MEWCWACLTCFIFLKYYNKNMVGQKANNQLPTNNYQQLLVNRFKSVIRKLTIRSSNLLVDNRSFTLVELLVVIALIAVLAVAVILSLNPSELLKQGRDSTRLSDLQNLNRSLSWFNADTGGTGFMGSSSVIYVSVPDTSPTCSNLGLPTPPPGWSYHCVTQENLQKTDGSGWIPVNFNQISFGKTLTKLPIDPINQTSTGNYYTYVAGGSWALSAQIESQKYRNVSLNDGGTNPAKIELGTNLNLIAQSEGLVGYWSFDEGSGTIAKDSSGNGNTLTIGAIGSNVIWDSGKIGTALNYLPSAKTATTPCPTGAYLSSISSGPIYNLPQGNYTFIAFVKLSAGGTIAKFNTQYSVPNYFGGHWHIDCCHLLARSDDTNGGIGHGSLPIDNQWHQYVYVFNLSSNIQKAFTDGVQTNSGSLTGSFGNISHLNFGIYDVYWCGAGHAITGLIDEVRLYNRALSDAEIKAIYDATK